MSGHKAHWPDAVLAVLVLAFAFLISSFAVRNSDFWLHLAAGRLLAQGQYTFGVDPFAYTTGGLYWANHAWLFDLALYAGHHALGDAGLVMLKAAAVAVLAGLMISIARSAGPFWVSGGCILLAILAMSPRLLLQPACLSLLLLAVCLWLLRSGGRSLYAVPAVIALWVNVDGWFVLGPVLAVLFATGQLCRGRNRVIADSASVPLWLLPACLAACLLSPHHVHALTLPAELSPGVWRSALRHDVRFASLFASPWSLGPLGRSGGFNLSAWAYFVLLALSLASFALDRSARRDWRLPVWLVFAMLGAWQSRLVPFFAVVAGPITALNLRSLASADTTREGDKEASASLLVSLSPCLLVCFASLALIALTFPGWLQGFQRRDRPLAWEIHIDPSLRRVAETLGRWRQQGILPPGARSFAVHPDVAHYCAWFCPGERSFLDSRLPLFLPKAVDVDYEAVCVALDPTLRSGATGGENLSSAWQRVLRDNRIACLLLYDPDLRRLAPGLRQATQSPGKPWDLIRVDGQAIIVTWREAESSALASLRFDAERSAFAAVTDEVVPPAPGEGSAQLAAPLSWWNMYLHRASGSSWETDAAAIYLSMFEEGAAQQAQQQRRAVLARHAAGLIALPAVPAGPAPILLSVPLRLGLEEVYLADLFERPSALSLLAVRAARRALASHMDDAMAWFRLAQAYRALSGTTAEASRHAVLPPLAEVRAFQIVTALSQAVSLKPDLAPAQEALADFYTERQCLDLALQHRIVQLQLVRQSSRPPSESQAVWSERIDGLERTVEQLRNAVEDSENRFVVRSQSLAADPLARARLALQLGLAGKALDGVLLRSHPDLYGVAGLRLLLELLLLTGRADDARLLLDRDEMRRNPIALGFHDLPGTSWEGRRWTYRFLAYDWFDLCQTAATGNYDRASSVLERMRSQLKRQGEQMQAQLFPQVALGLTSELGLGAAPAALALRATMRWQRNRVLGLLVQNEFQVVERADLHVLEGMLLLERGQPDRARELFRQALPLYRLAAETAPARPGQPLALYYLERLGASVPHMR